MTKQQKTAIKYHLYCYCETIEHDKDKKHDIRYVKIAKEIYELIDLLNRE